jgi:hypothetical protein
MGFYPAVFTPEWFVQEQITQPAEMVVNENSRLISQQLGNCYGMAFLIAIAVLYSTSELKVIRSYLMALLIADFGHIGLTCYGLGYDRFTAPGEWNSMTWGNVGMTVSIL